MPQILGPRLQPERLQCMKHFIYMEDVHDALWLEAWSEVHNACIAGCAAKESSVGDSKMLRLEVHEVQACLNEARNGPQIGHSQRWVWGRTRRSLDN
jgi:hypothetical protein